MVLCDTCARATAVDCPFLGADDPEDGLRALAAEARALGYKIREVRVKTKRVKSAYRNRLMYQVQVCPLYRTGPLPPIRLPVVPYDIADLDIWEQERD